MGVTLTPPRSRYFAATPNLNLPSPPSPPSQPLLRGEFLADVPKVRTAQRDVRQARDYHAIHSRLRMIIN